MQIFRVIKSLFNKIFNKLFGKAEIFIIILGWFLLITGIWMLWRPEKARKSLAGQGFGQAKFYLLLLSLFLGMLLFSFGMKTNGILAKIVMIVGLVALARAYFLFKKKAAQKISAWVEKVPIKFLKIYAVIQTIIGAAMLLLKKRIWY